VEQIDTRSQAVTRSGEIVTDDAPFQLTYDLTTCCFTLLELPSAEARLTAVDNLWRKTEGFLVLIEEGTNAGFQASVCLLFRLGFLFCLRGNHRHS
jgi:ribosomal protein RSM22 (predicted rRNA methylase)